MTPQPLNRPCGVDVLSDRELVALAASAYQHDNPTWHQEGYDAFRYGFLSAWNPLKNDGDALRLASKLGIDIQFCHSSGCVTTINPWSGAEFVEHPPKDAPADVRRAIVRAAAAIGSQP